MTAGWAHALPTGQRRVFDALHALGRPATAREIADAMGEPQASVGCQLGQLLNKDLVARGGEGTVAAPWIWRVKA